MPSFLLPDEPITSLAAYLATDTGGKGVERAQQMGPAATIDEVLRSGLRGRGGGGFLTGRKWAGLAAQTGTRRFLVVNGAEGEPGTFKGGLATAAARAMLNEAFADPHVDAVLAHTLPERNSSNRILENLGFRFDGETFEGDEQVWRFRLDRSPTVTQP